MTGAEHADFFTIVERHHRFQNPTSEEKLDLLIDYCGFRDGIRVLDVGCGKAWLLRRILTRHAVDAVGLELRGTWVHEAMNAWRDGGAPGVLNVVEGPAASFAGAPQSFDVAMCIGASFTIGTFEEMLDWLLPLVKPGGVIAVGDIYAHNPGELPPESAQHFAGGAERSLVDTCERFNRDGLSLIGLIDSSLDDWDRYESLHWRAAEEWLQENAEHPKYAEFRERHETMRRNHLRFDRATLGWALFVARVSGRPTDTDLTAGDSTEKEVRHA